MSAPSQYQALEFDFRTGRPWRRSLVRAFRRWIAWKAEQRRIRREIRELVEKNDWLLQDVGLTRYEVKTAEDEGAGSVTVARRMGRGHPAARRGR